MLFVWCFINLSVFHSSSWEGNHENIITTKPLFVHPPSIRPTTGQSTTNKLNGSSEMKFNKIQPPFLETVTENISWTEKFIKLWNIKRGNMDCSFKSITNSIAGGCSEWLTTSHTAILICINMRRTPFCPFPFRHTEWTTVSSILSLQRVTHCEFPSTIKLNWMDGNGEENAPQFTF